jgi:hypothetical protein
MAGVAGLGVVGREALLKKELLAEGNQRGRIHLATRHLRREGLEKCAHLGPEFRRRGFGSMGPSCANGAQGGEYDWQEWCFHRSDEFDVMQEKTFKRGVLTRERKREKMLPVYLSRTVLASAS